MKEVRLNIQFRDDKEKLVSALANSGYKVWVEQYRENSWSLDKNYVVAFEYNEQQLKKD